MKSIIHIFIHTMKITAVGTFTLLDNDNFCNSYLFLSYLVILSLKKLDSKTII